MKKLRRWHLYLGCFFTPLLFLYLFSGFILTGWPAEQKGPEEAQSFIQKLYWVHKHQFYPVTSPQPPEPAAITSTDSATDTLNTAAPHNYKTGQRGTLTPFSPGGLNTDEEYHVHVTSTQAFTLHTTAEDATSGANPIDVTGGVEKGFDVFFKPPAVPARSVESYNQAPFRLLVYAMTLGVLGTMALGVMLAIKVTKDRRPVYTALALGVLIPILFLWGGQSGKNTTSSPAENNAPTPPAGKGTPPGQPPGNIPIQLPDLNTTLPPDDNQSNPPTANQTEPIDPFGNP